MNKNGSLVAACIGLTLLAGVLLAGRAGSADDDTAAVKKRSAEFTAAWNQHDAKLLAGLWAEDGDLINPWGRLAAGRAQVETLFTDEQTGKGPMRESSFRVNSETVRFPSPDFAVHDSDITITGIHPPGATKSETMDFHVTWIWKKAGGTWSIYAARPYSKPQAPAPGN